MTFDDTHNSFDPGYTVASKVVDAGATISMRRAEVTVGRLLDLVEQHYKDNQLKTRDNLKYTLKPLRAWFQDRSRVTTDDVEQYKSYRLNCGLARASIDVELAALRRGFKLGIDRELIQKAPKITLYKPNNARKGFFEKEQFEKIRDELAKPKHANGLYSDMLTVAFLTGRRQSEIRRLRWEDYLKDAKVLLIPDSKNNKPWTVPVMGELQEILQKREKEIDSQSPCPLIFNRAGKPVSKITLWRHYRAAAKSCGLDSKLFHDTRRTAVRDLMRAGVERSVAMQITGHKTEKVFERYNIVDEQDLKNAMTKLNHYRTIKPGDEDSSDPTRHTVAQTNDGLMHRLYRFVTCKNWWPKKQK